MPLPPVSFPTLGWQVIDWIEAFLCHGPGDVQGELWTPGVPGCEIDDEEALFICWLYRVWPHDHPRAGRRLAHRAIYSRAKGRRKSELAGALMCAEALGPVRCDGFDARGEPVGVPVTYPFVRCLATEEEQAGNTYDNVVFMLTEGAAANEYALDIGRSVETSSRVFIREPGGGEIRPSSSGDASKDGGKESSAVADEPLALDTPVPTSRGWTTMGEIAPGDHVFGVDGNPILVWGVSPVKRDRDCFRVTFEDGTSIVSDALHRWKVQDRYRGGSWREMTTGEMAAAPVCGFRVPPTLRQNCGQAITAIERVPSVPVRCIAVDSDDHLFLAGEGMVPTHNTHLYVSRQLRGMYGTVSRNTGKRKLAEPLILDTTTAWQPGERSIAEQAADRYAHLPTEECLVKHGVLYDHRQGDEPKRFGDDRSLIKAMRSGYGPAAAWMDFERIVKIIRDAEDPEADAYRYFLNRARAASSHWLSPADVAAVLATVDVRPGSKITGGFDGSENSDHTALFGCTEQGDLFTVGVWTPEGDDLGWRQAVHNAVEWLFSTFKVIRFYGDPPWWQEEMGRWAASHGSPPIVEFWTNIDAKMAVACGAARTAIRQRGILIDPVPRMTEEQHRDGRTLVRWHFENARTRKVRVKFEDRAEEAHVVRKDRPGSPLKIDSVTSAVLARRARDDALKAGEFEEPDYGRWTDGSSRPSDRTRREDYLPCSGCGKPIHPKLHEPGAPERGLCVRCRTTR